MNQEESLALYAEGKDAWNSWAEEMLAQKKALEDAGKWEAEHNAWADAAGADFEEHYFDEKYIDFASFIFPAIANFSEVKFSAYANFRAATFSGIAHFRAVTFSADAWFYSATFSGDAKFLGATFSDDVWFDEATFDGPTAFYLVTFKKLVSFAEATFTSKQVAVSFVAIHSVNQFSLKQTIFSTAPDFEQAHFEEAPSLDEVRIDQSGDSSKDIPPRWRHLRRLALQGHDHERELDFLAGEILSRRKILDFPLGKNATRYLIGVLYEQFSDFGRSIAWPIFWWLLGTYAYFSLCMAQYFANSDAGLAQASNGCLIGNSTPFWTGLKIAFDNAFIIPMFGVSDGHVQEKLCLFGADTGLSKAGVPLVPLVPDFIAFGGFMHAIFSATMIFLFLLAVRNHFRIR